MLWLSCAWATTTLFLNAEGGTYIAGPDNSAVGTSSILRSREIPSVEVLPFRPGGTVWRCSRSGDRFDFEGRLAAGDHKIKLFSVDALGHRHTWHKEVHAD